MEKPCVSWNSSRFRMTTQIHAKSQFPNFMLYFLFKGIIVKRSILEVRFQLIPVLTEQIICNASGPSSLSYIIIISILKNEHGNNEVSSQNWHSQNNEINISMCRGPIRTFYVY